MSDSKDQNTESKAPVETPRRAPRGRRRRPQPRAGAQEPAAPAVESPQADAEPSPKPARKRAAANPSGRRPRTRRTSKKVEDAALQDAAPPQDTAAAAVVEPQIVSPAPQALVEAPAPAAVPARPDLGDPEDLPEDPTPSTPASSAPTKLSLAEPAAEAAEVVIEASAETVSGIVTDTPTEDLDELDPDTLAELELAAAEAAVEEAEAAQLALPETDGIDSAAQATAEAIVGEGPPRRRRRRRRGRGRRGRGGQDQAGQAPQVAVPGQQGDIAQQPRPQQPLPPRQQQQQQQRPQPQARPLPQRPQPPQPQARPAVLEDLEEGEDVSADKVMLVNIAQSDECRIAMIEEGQLQEFYIERTAALSHVGNVYKGLVTNVEPSIQAAFIDFGQGKNGFLHISDLQPQYFPGGGEAEDVGRKTPRKERPPIQKCLRRGQEIIVQVTKEGIGTKGATLTTYVALPGRYLVMMPGMSRLGVSRKIEDEDARRRMRDVLNQLELPGEMGFILRTAGLDRNKRELQRDLNYLARLWKQIIKRKSGIKAPAELFKESDLVTRTLRDVVTTDVKEILIDDEAVANSASQFLRLLSPRLADRVKYYTDSQPLFFKYGVEDELAKMYSKRVPLRSGGSLVIESTEALVAIDVNSGKFREAPDPEESAFRINLEAAGEIARQLSLRDLGGVIICDFIDMHMERHRREIERALREALKKHKERAEILRMSRFGIIEMTRQRQRPSIVRSMLVECPHCGGGGLIKSIETLMLEALRAIQTAATHPEVARIEVKANPQVAQMLLNSKRRTLAEIESQTNRSVVVIPMPDAPANKITVNCVDGRGWAVQVPLPRALMNGGQ